MARAPIILYHDIRPQGWNDDIVDPLLRPYILPLSEFERQIDYLVAQGYKGISIERFFELREREPEVLEKVVVIIFDDGWDGQYRYALPALKRAGFSGTFFIVPETVGRNGYMDWDSVKNLIESGMEVGSHTMTHPYPTELTLKELQWELVKSKAELETRLGRRIHALSSPTGFIDPRMPTLARITGYTSLCVSQIGLNGPSTDPFRLKKIGIKQGQRFETFVGIVERNRKVLIALRSAQLIRNLSKKILRRRQYERLKSALLGPLAQSRVSNTKQP